MSIHGDLSSLEILYSGTVYRNETALTVAGRAVQPQIEFCLSWPYQCREFPRTSFRVLLIFDGLGMTVRGGRNQEPHECRVRNASFSLSIEC